MLVLGLDLKESLRTNFLSLTLAYRKLQHGHYILTLTYYFIKSIIVKDMLAHAFKNYAMIVQLFWPWKSVNESQFIVCCCFCRDVLCSHDVVSLINSCMMCWACNTASFQGYRGIVKLLVSCQLHRPLKFWIRSNTRACLSWIHVLGKSGVCPLYVRFR